MCLSISGSLILLLVYLFAKGVSLKIKYGCWLKLSLFCTLASIASLTLYVAVEHIPVGSASALRHSSWMITVPIASPFILKEKIGISKWVAIILCAFGSTVSFIGYFKIDTPNIDGKWNFPASLQQHEEIQNITSGVEDKQVDTGRLIFGLSMAILDGVFSMGLVIVTKKMQGDVENILVLPVWYNISGIVGSLIAMTVLERHHLAFPTDAKNIAYIFLHSSSNVVTTFSKFLAFSYGSSVVSSITLNAELPMSTLCQYILFPNLQPLGGSMYDLVGTIMITVGITLTPLFNLITYCKCKKAQDNECKSLITGDVKPD